MKEKTGDTATIPVSDATEKTPADGTLYCPPRLETLPDRRAPVPASSSSPSTEEREPFRALRTFPESAGEWARDVFLGGILQAGAIRLVGAMVPVFAMLFFPFFAILVDPLVSRFAFLAGTFALGSLVAGHLHPHHAFVRSGFAFLVAAAGETAWLYQERHLMTLAVDRGVYIFALLCVGGALVSAFAGALGARAKRGFGGWIQHELDEFFESLGFRTEPGE